MLLAMKVMGQEIVRISPQGWAVLGVLVVGVLWYLGVFRRVERLISRGRWSVDQGIETDRRDDDGGYGVP